MPKRRRITKYVASDVERWRISILASYGFYARTIAKQIWGGGNPKYKPSDTEISRVYRIARKEGVKLSEWRRGENSASQNVLSSTRRVSKSKHPKPRLRIVA